MAKQIGKKNGRTSWLRHCKIEQLDKVSGTLLRPVQVRFYGMYKPVDLQDRDGDFDYVVTGTDRIDKLAKRFYGDQGLWWVIAQRNNLDLPSIQLQESMVITIPDPVYVKNTIAGKRQS